MTKSESMEAEVRRRVEALSQAVRARNLDAVMSFYTPDNVTLEFDPPLRCMGSPNKRRVWRGFFDVHRGDIGYDIRDLSVTVQGEVAFVRSRIRVTGTLPSGSQSEMWVRWTACFKRIAGVWQIAHDHVSVPVRVKAPSPVIDTAPAMRFG